MRIGKKSVSLPFGRYLIHNASLELELVSEEGYTHTPFGQRALVEAMVDRKDTAGWDEGTDNFVLLCVDKDGLSFSEFSGEFMDNIDALIEARASGDEEAAAAAMKELLD